MVDLTAVYAALRQAHAAGDTKGATRLAQYIREVTAGGVAEAEKPPETTIGGNVKELFKGLVPGAVNLVESAAVGASALLPEETEKAAREKIKSVATAVRAPFAAAPGYEDTIPRKLGESLGSTAPFLLAGPFGLAGRAAATGLGVGAGAGEARTRAEEAGATDEQRSTATALGVIPGAFEVFAPFRILSRIPTASKAAGVELVKRAFVAGGEEAAQEVASGFAQNLIAKGVYKPEQELIEGLGEQAAYGGATGAIVQGLMDLALGRRSASAATPGTPTDAEQRAQAERERRATLMREQGLGEEAKAAQAQGYVGQQGQLFRGLEKPTEPQRDLAGQILEPAPDEAAPRPSDLYEGMPLTTEVAQEAGFARTPEELEAAGQQQLGLDEAQDTEFFQQEMATLDKEYTALQAKKGKTSADNQRMREIRTRRTQLTEFIRERTANRGPQIKQGQDQGELFTPAELRKGERSFTPIPAPAQTPTQGVDVPTQEQLDLMPEAALEYADLVKMREQLKAAEQTPQTQARIKYLDGQIRDYTLAGVDEAYQQRVEREATEGAVAEQQAREAALAEQSAFAQQPDGQPVPEPTVRVKPTPETVPTLMSPDVLGTLGIGHSALLRKPSHPIHGLDITKPEDAAEVKKMLSVYKEGKSAPIVQKVDAYLARPEFQGVPDVPATTAAQPAPEVSDQPGGRERSLEVPVQPATTELSEPGPGATPTTEESAAPVGRGLVPTGPDAGEGDARVSDAQPAVSLAELQKRARALTEQTLAMLDKQGRVPREGTKKRAEYDAIVEQERAAKDAVVEADRAARKPTPETEAKTEAKTETKTETKPKKAKKPAGVFDALLQPGETVESDVEAMAEKMVAKEKPKPKSKSPFDISGPSTIGAELQADADSKKRRSVSSAAEGQTLASMQAEIARMPGLLGAALRRMLKSGKVKLEAASPDGRKVGGLYDGKAVTLYANGIPEGKVLAVALHEVGAHLGMKNLVGAKQYDAIIARLQAMVQKGDGSVEAKMAQAAYKRIPIRDMKRGPEVFGDELLAYFVEEMVMSEAAGTLPKVGALRNMYNQIKTGILTAINRVFGTSLGIKDLTANQIQTLAEAAFTKESYTAAKGETTAASARESVPGMAELNPEDRAAIQALQAELPVEERGSKGVVGQAMRGIKSARENSSIFTILRQKVVDKYATVEAKVSGMFSKGFEDSFGNANPFLSIRQAEDSHKIAANFLRDGGIRMNKDGTMETFAQDASVVSAFTKVNEFAKANNMTYEEAKKEISTVLEGHRIHGIRKYNNDLEQSAIILAGKGKTKEAAAERARKIQVTMTNEKIDQMEAIYQKSKAIQSIQADLNATRTQAIDLMVKTGRITKERGEFWKDNKDYVPFDRVFDDEPSTPKFVRGKGLAALDSYPTMTGSLGRPVYNVLDSYAGRLSSMIEDTMRNNASVRLLETMELGGFATEVSKPAAAKNKDLVLTLYRDGEPVHFEVQNKYDMLAFMQAPEVTNFFVKLAGGAADILRTTVTAMPPFAVKQVVDDMQRAAFNSGVERPLVVAMKTLYNFPRVLFGELTGRKLPGVVRLGKLGVYGEYDINIYKPVEAIEKELGFVKRNPAGKFLNALEKITKASDLAARLAVYEETMRESKGNETLAQTRARELINFNRRGASPTMRVLTRVVPFFNAYAQGTDVLYRAATGRDGASSGERIAARNLFMSRIAIMTALGFAYAFAMSDDEDYKNATDEVRDSNWLFPGAIKSPVPKELGFLFKSIPERLVEHYNRYGTAEEKTIMDTLGSVVKGAGNTYLFSTPLPTLLRPIVENMTNYSFFLGRELESPSLQAKQPGFRYESSTSELAKAMGEATNISPIKIDNFLRGMFGLAGSTTLMATDALLNPARADRPIHQLPFASIFLYDPVGGRDKSEFYRLREKVGQADATFKGLLKTDPDKADKFFEANEALISAAPIINNTLRDLSKMRALRTMVEQGTEDMLDMSGKERRELIDEIRGSENELVSYTRELEKMLRE
jgi:hypothetical protein